MEVTVLVFAVELQKVHAGHLVMRSKRCAVQNQGITLNIYFFVSFFCLPVDPLTVRITLPFHMFFSTFISQQKLTVTAISRRCS